MKKTVIFLLTLFFMAESICQAPALSREYYLEKSKNQKAAGWILLGGGTALAAVGIILASNDNPEPYDIYGSNFETGTILMATGLVADLVSIPFFIGSANNARRAASISFTNQKVVITAKSSFLIKTQPAVTLTITL